MIQIVLENICFLGS